MVKGAHSAPLYSMHRLGEKLVATGDDAGWIKVRCHSLDAINAMINTNVSSGKGSIAHDLICVVHNSADLKSAITMPTYIHTCTCTITT